MDYTKKPNWELVVEAITAIGKPCSINDIKQYFQKYFPQKNSVNVQYDTPAICVNSNSRVHYTYGKKPRRTDSGNKYDKLFQREDKKYELYNPKIHGVWEIVQLEPESKPFIRKVNEKAETPIKKQESLEAQTPSPIKQNNLVPTQQVLLEEQLLADDQNAFDVSSITDGRHKILATVVRRQGQPAFREKLTVAYSGACAITGCDVIEALEAAHIHPYRGPETNSVNNGILLRSDIHTLFDIGLIRINPEKLTIHISQKIMSSIYGKFHGRQLNLPIDPKSLPNKEALEWHFSTNEVAE